MRFFRAAISTNLRLRQRPTTIYRHLSAGGNTQPPGQDTGEQAKPPKQQPDVDQHIKSIKKEAELALAQFKKTLERHASQRLEQSNAQLGQSTTEFSEHISGIVHAADWTVKAQEKKVNNLLKTTDQKIGDMERLGLAIREAADRFDQTYHEGNQNNQQKTNNQGNKNEQSNDHSWTGWMIAFGFLGNLIQAGAIWWFGYVKPRRDELHKHIISIWQERSKLTAEAIAVSEFCLMFPTDDYVLASQTYTDKILKNKQALIEMESRFKAIQADIEALKDNSPDKYILSYEDLEDLCDQNLIKLDIMRKIQDLIINLNVSQTIFNDRYDEIIKQLDALKKHNTELSFYPGFIKMTYGERDKEPQTIFTDLKTLYQDKTNDFGTFKDEFNTLMGYNCPEAMLAKYIYIQLNSPCRHYIKTCYNLMDIRDLKKSDSDYQKLSDEINSQMPHIEQDDIQNICSLLVEACHKDRTFVPAYIRLGFMYTFVAILLDADPAFLKKTGHFDSSSLELETLSGKKLSLAQANNDLNDFKKRLLEEAESMYKICASLDINHPHSKNNLADIYKELGRLSYSTGDKKDAAKFFRHAKVLITDARKTDALSGVYSDTEEEIDREIGKTKGCFSC